eukprot:2830747-Pyramimonas_sp.AAC.1
MREAARLFTLYQDKLTEEYISKKRAASRAADDPALPVLAGASVFVEKNLQDKFKAPCHVRALRTLDAMV